VARGEGEVRRGGAEPAHCLGRDGPLPALFLRERRFFDPLPTAPSPDGLPP
jgi:hypothetical protein